jgi:hypothetical protein
VFPANVCFDRSAEHYFIINGRLSWRPFNVAPTPRFREERGGGRFARWQFASAPNSKDPVIPESGHYLLLWSLHDRGSDRARDREVYGYYKTPLWY